MYAIVSNDRLQLRPGGVVRFPCTWQEYQQIEQSRGNSSIPRIKYRDGEILLMVPLPEHGKDANVLSDVVKVLLEAAQQDYDAFTPITMKLPQSSGIEPDYCFYISNWQAVQGKKRIDWQSDPPPDLVIEVDLTSFSAAADYLPYRVPEVWMLRGDQLRIHQLQEGAYRDTPESRYFPGVQLQAIVAECLQVAYERNTSAAIRSLRARLQ